MRVFPLYNYTAPADLLVRIFMQTLGCLLAYRHILDTTNSLQELESDQVRITSTGYRSCQESLTEKSSWTIAFIHFYLYTLTYSSHTHVLSIHVYWCTGTASSTRATASNTRTSIQMLWAAPMPQQLPKPPQQQQQWRWQQQVGAEVAWETCVRFGGWWLRWWSEITTVLPLRPALRNNMRIRPL